MAWSQEKRCLLWLSAAEIAADRVYRLMEKYGSARGVWEAFDTGAGPSFQEKPLGVLRSLRSPDALEELIARMEKKHIRALFRGDPEYPELLNAIDDPPYLLYYVGHLQSLRRPMVSIVGTRTPSRYAKEMAFSLAQGLAEVGVCVVSGLARGIDSCAHEGALQARGVTAAVLGSGLNACYPPEKAPLLRSIVAGGGLALSEYPLDAQPATYHFPHRNRVISGLSHGLVFVEGKARSGGMITVATALSQGREVFAVPGQVGTVGAQGPHAILREGARLVTCAQDILADLSLDLERFRPSPGEEGGTASPLEAGILSALGKEALGLEALCQATGASAQELMTQLSMMEITGQVSRESGNLFRRSLC